MSYMQINQVYECQGHFLPFLEPGIAPYIAFDIDYNGTKCIAILGHVTAEENGEQVQVRVGQFSSDVRFPANEQEMVWGGALVALSNEYDEGKRPEEFVGTRLHYSEALASFNDIRDKMLGEED